ncbi:MAG: DUF2778 domain-containing protein [Parafilimonas terrae]|nr:DUF2778 domain-containing protein [Parafilimonas terrae]
MAMDSVQPDGLDITRSRRSCFAPLTVLTGAVAMALVGSGVIHRVPQPIPSAGKAVAHAIAPETIGIGQRADLASETPIAESQPAEAPTRNLALEESEGDASGETPPHWALTQIAPLGNPPAPESPPAASAVEPPRAAMTVPLPVPRPPELRGSGATAFARRVERRMARRDMPPVQSVAPPADEPSFFEKLFGIERGPALAYTALESKPVDVAPQRRIAPPLPLSREPSASAGVAVYNIATRTVTLPSGERLEAHSGLGEGLDEPRLVNVRMRGPTPPGTYDLTEREQLFHGVRAIRLTPVGGSEAVYGRVGLLAHTFMLGPRGDSNGCVSFRDYDRFLQAFLRGEVQRLVVVSGTQDPLPAMADGGRTRVARNGG